MGIDLEDLKRLPHDLVIDAFAAIAKVADLNVPATIVTVVRTIVNALRSSAAGKITPEQVREEMQHLLSAIEANDDRADTDLTEKFKKPPTP